MLKQQGSQIYGLKRVRTSSCEESAIEPFVNEIELLVALKDKDNIIQLLNYGIVRNADFYTVYMVFEYGEIDLHK